jgi:hypothetical protein
MAKSNPPTPIPRRASALPPGAIRVRPKYPRRYNVPQEEDVTRIPTMPQPTMWQYETPNYDAESSLSSLSLVVSEASPVVSDLHVDELETLPPSPRRTAPLPDEIYGPIAEEHVRRGLDISEIDTHPPVPTRPARSLTLPNPTASASSDLDAIAQADTIQHNAVTVAATPAVPAARPRPTYYMEGAQTSWTAGSGANSAYARRIAQRDRRALYLRSLNPHPVDHARWWLLYPGRLEFLLWLAGTLLLLGVTAILLVSGALSLGMLNVSRPGDLQAVPLVKSAAPCNNAPVQQGAHCTSTGSLAPLQLIMLSNASLTGGTPVRLRGEGFSPGGVVNFTCYTNHPCRPDSLHADAQGEFTVALMPGDGSAWTPGHHHIIAYDVKSKRSVSLGLLLSSNPAGDTATSTPASSSSASSTSADGSTNQSGSVPTSVNQTPAPLPSITPTVQMKPAKPTPLPVATRRPSTPTPQPTVGITPTVSSTSTVTPAPTATRNATSDLAASQTLSLHTAYQQPLIPDIWLWLFFVGYALAMALLGAAGVLHRRRFVRFK